MYAINSGGSGLSCARGKTLLESFINLIRILSIVVTKTKGCTLIFFYNFKED